MITRRVAIVGIGQTAYGKALPGTAWDLAVEAVTKALADAGIDPAQVGLGAAATEVVSFSKRPPREAGTIVKDEGDGGVKAAEFLAAQKFI